MFGVSLLLFFNVLSAQVFIKSDSRVSVKENAFIYSQDSIASKPVAVEKPKMYIVKGTLVYRLRNLTENIVYIYADKDKNKPHSVIAFCNNRKSKPHTKPALASGTNQKPPQIVFSEKPIDKTLSGSRLADVVMILSSNPFSKYLIIANVARINFADSYLYSVCYIADSKEKINVSHNNYSVTRPPPVLI